MAMLSIDTENIVNYLRCIEVFQDFIQKKLPPDVGINYVKHVYQQRRVMA
jgi:hypothetical protein